jgi:hypothetical protein
VATEFPIGANTRPAVISIDQLIAALIRTGKAANMSEKEIQEMVAEIKRGSTEGVRHVNNFNRSFDSLNGTVNKISGTLVTVFAIDRVLAFGKAVISITAEFEKLEAVLTNTLGSRSKARLALIEIAKFAAQTPFAVKELTEGFVKLANQGIVLTQNEMRRLGDIAASTGKDYLMLVEAIIDAQVGEFERLKEFGIRASKEGEKVTFTFKGVKTQVDFTTESIRNYIFALGDAEGVSGSMAKISETLAGQISNAGDNFDTFFNNLGKYNKGPIGEFFRLFNAGMAEINEAMTLANTTAADIAEIPLKRFRDAYAAAKQEVEKQGSFEKLNQLFIDLTEAINSVNEDIERASSLLQFMDKESDTYKKLSEDLEIYQAELAGYKEIRQDLNGVVDDYNVKLEEQRKKAAAAAAEERRLMMEMLARQEAQKKNVIKTDVPGSGVDGEETLEAAMHRRMEKDKTEATKRNVEERDRIYNESFAKRRMMEEQAFNFTVSLINGLTDLQSHKNAAELSDLQDQRDRAIEAAGDNADAREKIERDFDRRQRELKRQQAERDKRQALFNIAITTAQGVMAALASVPPNIPLSLWIGAAGIAQAALVGARPLPKYKDGVYDLDGPGTSTSDSILARLSKGEDVVPAQRNARFGFMLKPIIEDPSLTLLDVRNMIDQRIPTEYRKVIFASAKGADTQELAREMRATREAMSNLKQVSINIDENGFQKWVKRGDTWTEYVNKRYRV